MTEIYIAGLSDYNRDAVATYLHICNDSEYKIIIPGGRINIEPVSLTAAVEYDFAAYAGDILINIAAAFAYYVPCPYTKIQQLLL